MSTDPRFEEKLQDVVALYLDPPDTAVVFSFDEKSSVQALDRTQPGLPMKHLRPNLRRKGVPMDAAEAQGQKRLSNFHGESPDAGTAGSSKSAEEASPRSVWA